MIITPPYERTVDCDNTVSLRSVIMQIKRAERNAATPADRVAALKAFHERGIFVWVSLEPTLDAESSLAVVEATHGFVDLYKIGQTNYRKEITRTTDWRDYTLRMIDLCQKLGARHYIKRDLQPYLPEGYSNPLRVPQHHGDAPASGAQEGN